MKLFDTLESRNLFSVVTTTPINSVAANAGQFPTTYNLSDYFDSTTINGTTVALNVTVGDITGTINFELFDSATPNTVANFLKYIDAGKYDNSLFHRSIADFVLQGGGFTFPGTEISTFGTINNEFATSPRDSSGKVNTRGTVAMAKVDGNPNSADSQFFINMVDSSGNLDTANGGFTTFARVMGSGMTFVDQLNDLPTVELESPFEDLPVSASYSSSAGTPQQDDVVLVTTADRVAPIKYSVSTSNIDIVNPQVDANGLLTLNYQPQGTGTATITIIATDLDGASLTTTFDVTVADSGTLKASYNGQTLNPNGSTPVDFLNISTALNGSVTRKLTLENTGNADILNLAYTLPDGFSVGSDAPTQLFAGQRKDVTITVDTSKIKNLAGTLVVTATADDIGQGAQTSTFSISLAADLQLPVTLGQNGIKAVTFVQADGTTATFTATGPGTATFDFDGTDVTASDNGKGTMVVSAAGGASLFGITFASTTLATKVKLASKGSNPVMIGNVSGVGTASLGSFEAKTARLTGDFIFGSSIATAAEVRKIVLGSAEGATMELGLNNDPAANLSMTIGTANNTTIFVGYTLASLTANSWTRGVGTGEIEGAAIGKLAIKGNFDSDLATSAGLVQATISGAVSGDWSLGTGLGKLSAASAASTFVLNSAGVLGTLAFKGDYNGTMSALGVNTFSAVNSTAGSLSATRYINSVTYKGKVLSGFVRSGYQIGKFSAVSVEGTRVYAGVNLQSGQVLALANTDFVADATLDGVLYKSSIGSFTVTGKNSSFAFSNSAVAAKTIGTLKSGVVLTGTGAPSQVTNGFSADFISSLSLMTDVGQPVSGKNLTVQSDVATLLNQSNNTAAVQVILY